LAQQRQQLQQQVAHQQQVAVLQQAALSQPQMQVCGFGFPAGLPQGVLLQPASSAAAAAAAGVWPSLPLNAPPPAAPQHLPQPQLHHPLQA
jgi:hypothetical protein